VTAATAASQLAQATGGHAAAAFLAAGNPRDVLLAAARACRSGSDAVLALVLEVDGSTYAGAGAMVLFEGASQVGWLSVGCLEPAVAGQAAQAGAAGGLHWVELDTRAGEDLLSGSAPGCRGRLRLALLPLRAMPGAEAAFEAWLQQRHALLRVVSADGSVALQAGGQCLRWRLPATPPPWPAPTGQWRLPLPRLPCVLVFG